MVLLLLVSNDLFQRSIKAQHGLQPQRHRLRLLGRTECELFQLAASFEGVSVALEAIESSFSLFFWGDGDFMEVLIFFVGSVADHLDS